MMGDPTLVEASSELRQRKPFAAKHPIDAAAEGPVQDVAEEAEDPEVMWGKTVNGQVFRVPTTHSFVHTLMHTIFSSTLTLVTLFTLLAQPLLFIYLPSWTRSPLYLAYFAFWRASYDFGLGYILRKQSERKYIVRKLRSWGWLSLDNKASSSYSILDKRSWNGVWWKRELEAKLGKEGYSWDAVPEEFNAWLIFRQLVDVILLNDFLSYSLFAIANLHFPANQSLLVHALRWIVGWALIVFNLWVKIDAHRVVKDYAWYWGDAFWLIVQQKELVFDGVYEIAPHPMYSVGYAGYYGLSIVTGSYTVFFASLIAHAAQFAFLLWFENPHIERTYGGAKKPLAGRKNPEEDTFHIGAAKSTSNAESLGSMSPPGPTPIDVFHDETPGATEGESESEEWVATPCQSHVSLPAIAGELAQEEAQANRTRDSRAMSVSSSGVGIGGKPMSVHDLTIKYLQKPVVVFANIDLFRSNDFAFTLLVAYAVLPSLFGPLLAKLPTFELGVLFLHALGWRLFHSFGLGLLLRAQSRSKWLVRHFLKHYHYPSSSKRRMSVSMPAGASEPFEDIGVSDDDVVQAATEDAFRNWKVVYNVSLVMTYVSFIALAWKIYSIPSDWTVSGQLLRHILGSLLISLHVWAAVSSYEVLGDFGWLYSDFFLLEQYPSKLAYTGIYRFLNNPERSMGGAAFLGLALISGSYLVGFLAIVSHLCHWWFLSFVEGPHMRKLYGSRLRKDGGLSKTLKNVANKHAKALEVRAGKHAPEIKRVISEVKGTFEKVEGKVTEAVEEFLELARPRINEVVQDTKILLQQSRERMIITRVANDISAYDTSRYTMTLPSGTKMDAHRFHVGQPIRVSWNAPANHSRKDWIGLYRLGSCKSQLVTRIASLGKWVPLYEDEWDGDKALSGDETVVAAEADAGTVVFDRDRLPWAPGQYELRLHHDGKHNVMTRLAPIEIFVNRCSKTSSYSETRASVMRVVTLALDCDPKLVPQSASGLTEDDSDGVPKVLDPGALADVTMLGSSPPPSNGGGGFLQPEDEADDFTIMEEKQAKRIVAMVEMVFGVELSTDVVMADANAGTIARRIMGAHSLSVASPRVDGD